MMESVIQFVCAVNYLVKTLQLAKMENSNAEKLLLSTFFEWHSRGKFVRLLGKQNHCRCVMLNVSNQILLNEVEHQLPNKRKSVEFTCDLGTAISSFP